MIKRLRIALLIALAAALMALAVGGTFAYSTYVKETPPQLIAVAEPTPTPEPTVEPQ